ncbi:uncharacterized protein ACO6RY_14054 [Pungitius sinensis]
MSVVRWWTQTGWDRAALHGGRRRQRLVPPLRQTVETDSQPLIRSRCPSAGHRLDEITKPIANTSPLSVSFL